MNAALAEGSVGVWGVTRRLEAVLGELHGCFHTVTSRLLPKHFKESPANGKAFTVQWPGLKLSQIAGVRDGRKG